MGDCHSSDPGSNPGPGAQPSVRIPISSTNIDSILTNLETGTSSLVQQQKENNNYNSDKYKVVKLFENH